MCLFGLEKVPRAVTSTLSDAPLKSRTSVFDEFRLCFKDWKARRIQLEHCNVFKARGDVREQSGECDLSHVPFSHQENADENVIDVIVCN